MPSHVFSLCCVWLLRVQEKSHNLQFRHIQCTMYSKYGFDCINKSVKAGLHLLRFYADDIILLCNNNNNNCKANSKETGLF